MPTTDPRVDQYIAKSAEFAKPILKHLRTLVHETCPDCEETMKWSFPHFEYRGVLCSMASFKEHCSFGFWKGALLESKEVNLQQMGETAMGHLGRITKLSDLPNKRVLTSLIKQAMKLNEDGTPIPRPKKPAAKRELIPPDYFMKALRRETAALKTFQGLSPSHKREYVEWVTEAKSEETRERRLATAIEWMSEGKPRNWKYVKK